MNETSWDLSSTRPCGGGQGLRTVALADSDVPTDGESAAVDLVQQRL